MKRNYANLDLLRSFAVLSVIAAHLYVQGESFRLWAFNREADQFLRNLSFAGVMFFFVHTCLVLMLSMHRAPAAHLGRCFLIRRAFLIYPLCWAVILLSLLTGLTDEAGGGFHALGLRGIAVNMLLVHNFVRGYSSVIGPLWSLDWEVQMYLVLPLFFVALRRYRRTPLAIWIWLGAVLLSIACTQSFVPRLFHAAVFVPMFAGGMVAYRMLERQSLAPRRHALPSWGWPPFILSLFVAQAALSGTLPYESPLGAAINDGICISLSVAIASFTELRAGWVVRPAQQIAKYSYGIYLLHVPALMFVLRYLVGLPAVLKVLAFLALTALLSFISFHTIENPLILLGKRLTQAQPLQADLLNSMNPIAVVRPAPWNSAHALSVDIAPSMTGGESGGSPNA